MKTHSFIFKPLPLILLTCCLFVHKSWAQLSLSAGPGIMKYQGDIDVNSYSLQGFKLCLAGGLQYQIGHIIVRSDFVSGSIAGSDRESRKRRNRNLSFATNILEFSLMGEYDLFDLSKGEKKITPYLFAGIGYFHFNPYAFDSAGTKQYLQPLGTEGQGLPLYPDRPMYSLTQTNIPFGGGLKYRLNSNFTFAVELTSRILNTDYLDDVSKTYPNPQALLAARGPMAVKFSFRKDEINPNANFPEGLRRGNPGSNDNYFNTNFKITYTLTRRSGFGMQKVRNGGSLKCPSKVL